MDLNKQTKNSEFQLHGMWYNVYCMETHMLHLAFMLLLQKSAVQVGGHSDKETEIDKHITLTLKHGICPFYKSLPLHFFSQLANVSKLFSFPKHPP